MYRDDNDISTVDDTETYSAIQSFPQEQQGGRLRLVRGVLTVINWFLVRANISAPHA